MRGGTGLRAYDASPLIALWIILFWIVVGIAVLTRFYYSKEMKMTSETTGTVVSATEREIIDEKGRRDETQIVCRYVVGQTPYEITHTLRGRNSNRLAPGTPLKVLYNPGNPAMARIPVSSH